MQVIQDDTGALARYFTGRVEAARDTLAACHLSKYADEVCIMLPKSGAEFERFVYWAEAMRDTFARWASLAHVQAAHDATTLAAAHAALTVLAMDARALLTRHQARLARRGEV
jgi:hypothetical protein